MIQGTGDGDQSGTVAAGRVGSGQILDLCCNVLPTTGFTARLDERKKG